MDKYMFFGRFYGKKRKLSMPPLQFWYVNKKQQIGPCLTKKYLFAMQ